MYQDEIDEVVGEIVEVVAEELDVYAEDVKPELNLFDFIADSFYNRGLLGKLEDKFNITFDIDLPNQVFTVQALVEHTFNLLGFQIQHVSNFNFELKVRY